MKQTIYLDVLVSVNFLVDYFLLYAAGQLSASSISRTRLCLGALLGAAGSCTILLPPMNGLLNSLITGVICALMTLTAFGWHGARRYLRTVACVLLVTVCYAGLMLALFTFTAPAGLIVNNGSVYIDIPPALLVLATVVCYAAASLLSVHMRRRNLVRSRCTVTIYSEGSHVSLNAIIDTGNLLCEPFSGLPVIVAEYDRLLPVLPDGFEDFSVDPISASPYGIRVVPYSGIGTGGILFAFRPKKITAALPGCRPRETDAYIGVLRSGRIGSEHHAIVNPDILL